MEASAVILAAGRGERMKEAGNKVYLPLVGIPVLEYSLHAFAGVKGIDEIIIVTRRGEEEKAESIARRFPLEIKIVPGGERRQDSARAGAETARGKIVLIHDAARPFPSRALIERVLDGTKLYGACVPVIPVADTLRYTDPEGFLRSEEVARTELFRMQTPQGFLRESLLSAFSAIEGTITDDASAILATRGRVATVPGAKTNIKLTTKEDLRIAEALIRAGIVAQEDPDG